MASRHQSNHHHNSSNYNSHQNSQNHELNTQYAQKHYQNENQISLGTNNSNSLYGGADENNNEVSIVDEFSQAPYEQNNNKISEYFPLYQKQSSSNANSNNVKQSIVAKNRQLFSVKLNSQNGHVKPHSPCPNTASPQISLHSNGRNTEYAFQKNDDYLVATFRPFSNHGAFTPSSTSNNSYHPLSSSHMHQPANTTMSGVSSASSNTTSRYYRHLSNYVSGDLTSNMTASRIAPYASEKTTHVMKYGSADNNVSQYEINQHHKSNIQTSNACLIPPVYGTYNKQNAGFELTSLQQPQIASSAYLKKLNKNSREDRESANNTKDSKSSSNNNPYDTKRYSGTSSSGVKPYGENLDLARVGSTMITSKVLNGNYNNNNSSAQYLRINANNGYNNSNRAGSTSSNSNYDENEIVNANDLINGKLFFFKLA